MEYIPVNYINKNTIFMFFCFLLFYKLYKFILYLLCLKFVFRQHKINPNNMNSDEIVKYINNHFNVETNVQKIMIRSETEYLDTIIIKRNIPHTKLITIYCHGNSGNVYDCFQRHDIKKILSVSDLVLFDYRGYGNSTGKTTDKTFIEDLMAVYGYTQNILNYQNNNIIFYGNSLGSYVVSSTTQFLIKQNISIPKMLIMQNSFSTLKNITYDLFGMFGIVCYLLQFDFDNFKTLHAIQQQIPIILVHSIGDEYTNISHSKNLFNYLATYQSCKLRLYDANGNHDGINLTNIFDKLKDDMIQK